MFFFFFFLFLLLGSWKFTGAKVTQKKPHEERHCLRFSGIPRENIFIHFTRDVFPTYFL